VRRHLHVLLAAAAICGLRSFADDTAAMAQLKNMKHPQDVPLKLFAVDSQLSNPIGICVDPRGRVFVAESPRQEAGVYGTNSCKYWAIDDYTTTTLDGRRAMYAKHQHHIPLPEHTRISEVVRLLEDRNNDGRADRSTIFADGFNEMLDGAAAGVAERDGSVYLTCSPTLWKLDGDEKAEKRSALHEGFGIRVGIHGHDMHAPIWGPDGRLYFNVGDRGYSVKTIDGVQHEPTRGGVFRCEPDGSGLELYHKGVRNPQGMAFNDVGDLFTVDNDMGADDKSRVLFLVQGADSGWDATYQLTRNFRNETDRVDHGIVPPWLSEGLWKEVKDSPPAWVNSPAGHLTAGPSGMDYYPGVGLPERYNDHFFITDFRGGAARSGVYAFNLKRSGAGYQLDKSEQFVWQVLVSDCAFGFDGKLYIVDWIAGWRGASAGRIYTAGGDNTASRQSRAVARKGFNGSTKALAELLYHDNLKIGRRVHCCRTADREPPPAAARHSRARSAWA
jgi:quinoprotein glucose dehydrogenase